MQQMTSPAIDTHSRGADRFSYQNDSVRSIVISTMA
jgi:hypothetical protein